MRNAKRDQNELAIVRALEEAGCRAVRMPPQGGIPDLLVGDSVTGATFFIEVKAPGSRGLNALQRAFHASWPGRIYVVYYPDHVQTLLNTIRREP